MGDISRLESARNADKGNRSTKLRYVVSHRELLNKEEGAAELARNESTPAEVKGSAAKLPIKVLQRIAIWQEGRARSNPKPWRSIGEPYQLQGLPKASRLPRLVKVSRQS